MIKFFSIAFIALIFSSCENSGSPKTMDPSPSAPATTITPPPPVATSGNAGTVTNTPAAAATQTTTSSAAAIALNPAHGQPGHRCDIPVGTPLNSPAGSNPAPATNSNSAPVMLKPQAPLQPVNKSVRINPAHGAPGHDCSVPVGQPLKN